jgi:carbamoylphosphate synthase large subunit
MKKLVYVYVVRDSHKRIIGICSNKKLAEMIHSEDQQYSVGKIEKFQLNKFNFYDEPVIG